MKKLFFFSVLCALAFLAAPAPYSFAVEDATAPTVGTPTPTTATFGVPVTFSVVYSDDVGVTNCTLTFSEASPTTNVMTLGSSATSGTATFTITPNDSSEMGSAYAVCTDAAANVQVGATATVVVATADVVAPTVGVVSPLVATVGVATTVSATYSDAVGVASCDMYISGANVGPMTLGSSSTSGTATYVDTAASSGSFSIQAKCTDASGNVGSGASRTLVVSSDTTAPAVGAITPTTATQNTALTLSATYSDNIAATACTLYVAGVSQGAMTLASGTASKSYTFTMSGTSSVRATCVDAAGNTGSGSATTVTITASSSPADITAPVVGTITPLVATTGVALSASASYSDAVGVTSCTAYINGNAQTMTLSSGTASTSGTFEAEGSNTVYVTCVDAAGNVGTGSTVTIVVTDASASTDTTAPTVSSTTPLVAIADLEVTFSATYSDAVGVSSCTAYVDGAAQAMALNSGTAFAAQTFDAAGSYSVYVTCTDAAGNIGTGSTATVTVSAAVSTETTTPTIGAITPTTATQNTAVTFTATVTDASGIQECRLFVNGSDQGAMTASGSSYSKSYTPASSGTLTAYASCGDTVGNLGDGTAVTVTVAAAVATSTDTVAPTVGAIVSTQAVAGVVVPLIASVADSGGLGTCTLYVNGTNIGAMTVSGGNATYSYTFSMQGSATANAYCVDAAGNATRGASSTITIAANVTEEEASAVSEAAVGSLIKLACGADADVNDPCRAVYYYDTLRHAFPNEKVFFTWYEDFDDVIIVTADFMASITLSRNVTYHPGTRMVKFITVNTVYGVGESGELRAIASEDVAASIWGSSWNTLIDDISDAFFGNYTFGANIDSTSDFDPSVIKESVESILDIFAE